jgi:signal transduction histidine kinase
MAIKPLRKLTNDSKNQIWEQDEQILMFVRRHWFAIWPAYLSVILMIIGILVFVFLFYSLGLNQFLASLSLAIDPSKFFWLIVSMLILFLGLFLYLSWMEYYLDITIVTNRRVIDIEQLTLFQRRIVSAELASIQDVRSEVKGFFQSTLNFGTVLIQTAGEAPNFTLRDLPNPSNVVREISEAAVHSLNPEKESEKPIDNEEVLKVHEDEFAKEFKGVKNETQYLAPEADIEKEELSQDEEMKKENQISSRGRNIGQNKAQNKNEFVRHPELPSGPRLGPAETGVSGSQSPSPLSFPRKRESNKRIIHHQDKGEIDF